MSAKSKGSSKTKDSKETPSGASENLTSSTNSEEYEIVDPSDKALDETPSRLKDSRKDPRQLKNSDGPRHQTSGAQSSLVAEEWKGKGNSVESQKVKRNKKNHIKEDESFQSDSSDLRGDYYISDDSMNSGYSDEGEGLRSWASGVSSRTEESKAGAGKPSKQAETQKESSKGKKKNGVKDYTPQTVAQDLGSPPSSSQKPKPKRTPRPIGGKGGKKSRTNFLRKTIVKKKLSDSNDSSSSDDDLNKTVNEILGRNPKEEEKVPPSTNDFIVGASRMFPEETQLEDLNEDSFEDSFLSGIGNSQIMITKGFDEGDISDVLDANESGYTIISDLPPTEIEEEAPQVEQKSRGKKEPRQVGKKPREVGKKKPRPVGKKNPEAAPPKPNRGPTNYTSSPPAPSSPRSDGNIVEVPSDGPSSQGGTSYVDQSDMGAEIVLKEHCDEVWW